MVVELRDRNTLKKADHCRICITKSCLPNYKAPKDKRVAKKKSKALLKSKPQRKTQAKRRRASRMTNRELELEREKEIMEHALRVREQSVARRERAITRREHLLRAWELSYISMQRTEADKRVARVESNNTDQTQACPTARGSIQKSKKVVKQDPKKKVQIDHKRKVQEDVQEPEVEIITHYSVNNPKKVTTIDLTAIMEEDGGEYEEEQAGTSKTSFLGEEDIGPLRSAGSLLGRITPPSLHSRGAATLSRGHSSPNPSPTPSSTMFIEVGTPILWECPRINNLPNLPWERSSGSEILNRNSPSSTSDVGTQVNSEDQSVNGIYWDSVALQMQMQNRASRMSLSASTSSSSGFEIETQAQPAFEWDAPVYTSQLRNKPSTTSFRSALDPYNRLLKKDHIVPETLQ